jgi:O-antigen/teichoic acid export membrane protein
VFKKLFYYGGFSVGTTLFGVFSLPVLTAFLTPSEYGVLGLALTVLALLLPLNTFSNEHNVQKLRTNSSLDEYYSYWSALCSFSFLVLTVAFFLAIVIVYLFNLSTVFCLIPALAFARAFRLLKQAELTVTEREFLYGMSTLLVAVLSFIITFSVFYFYNSSASIRVFGLLLAEFLVCVVVLKIKFDFQFNVVKIREIMLFGFPLMISVIPAWLINESSRFFLLEYKSLSDVGLFTLAFQISAIYLQFNTVLSNTFVKRILGDIAGAFKFSFVIFITLIQVLGALSFLASINLLGKYILPDSYLSSLPIANYLVFGAFFQSLALLPSYYLSYYRMTKFRLYSLVFAAMIAISLNFFVIPTYGALGAALSYITSMFSYSLLLWFIVIRKKNHT